MHSILASITWDVNPEAFSFFGREVRWYGLLWAIGVLCTSYVIQRMYKYEKLPEKWFDSLFLYVIVGLIIGARLGHCLFYSPTHYLSHPVEMLKIWEGGLASHGGAIGMMIGVCLYSLKITKEKINWKNLAIWSVIGLGVGLIANFIFNNFLGSENTKGGSDAALSATIMGLSIGICISLVYTTRAMTIKTLDRLIVGVAIGATFIRLGNLMNHEIYGGATDLPWGFRFITNLKEWTQGMEPAFTVPSHPTQIYEALIYFVIFLLGMYLFYKTKAKEKTGLILGISLIGIFFSRFLIEYVKNVQEDFEVQMRAVIGMDMGQLLSLPFIIWGGWLVWKALKGGNKNEIKTTTVSSKK